MEEFYACSDDLNLATWTPAVIQILEIYRDKPGISGYERCLCGVLEHYDKMMEAGVLSLPRVVFLEVELSKMYNSVSKIAVHFPDVAIRITALAKACYEIDIGLYVVVGEEIKHLEPDQTTEEQQRILAVHDRARPLFKAAMMRGFSSLHTITERNYLIYWASLMYNHMHAFQAPLTTDVAQAARDAMGLSDHFRIMLQEVIDESPPVE
jgi:hypothetical protein